MTGDPYTLHAGLIAPFTGSLTLNIYINYNTLYLQGSTKDDTTRVTFNTDSFRLLC